MSDVHRKDLVVMSVDSNEDAASGDGELLHGNIGEPVGCDPPPRKMTSFRGKDVAKEFTVDNSDYSSLFCGIVGNYNQRTKKHSVEWEDDTTIVYTASEIITMRETFESWYARVSLGGRNMSRANASRFMVKAHKREQVQNQAKKSNASAAAAVSESSSEEDEEDRATRMSVYIMKMNVKDLRARCDKLKLNSTGLKKELRARLTQHYNCSRSLVEKETTKGKHTCKWERKIFADECASRPFTDTEFNVVSLTRLLPSFPDSIPSCGECYDFFHTPEMWQLGLDCTNNYPRTIRSQMQPPPWHKANQPWPPVWTDNPWTFTMKQFKANTAVMYLLGLKHPLFGFYCSHHKAMLVAKFLRQTDHLWVVEGVPTLRDSGEFKTSNFVDMLQLQLSKLFGPGPIMLYRPCLVG